MANYDLPIWIHPTFSPNTTNSEWQDFIVKMPYGISEWPVATANSMLRLVTSGVFNDYPEIKFITHHCGGVLPLLEGRVRWLY